MSVTLTTFVIVSAGIVAVSWRSLRHWRSHGFYRFFALESLLVLILLNAASWFVDPFCTRQIVSWSLLTGSTALALHGFYLLRRFGKPGGESIRLSTNLPLENTSTLLVAAYKHIRHPLYASLILLVWGVYLKQPSLLGSLSALAATAFLYTTAIAEERENHQRFGEEYEAYVAKTKRFIPFVF